MSPQANQRTGVFRQTTIAVFVAALGCFGCNREPEQREAPRPNAIAASPSWRSVTESDIRGEWRVAVDRGSKPYEARADFDGDGATDVAALHPAVDGKGWALIALLTTVSGRSIVVETGLDDPQNYVIDVIASGEHEHPCVRGVGTCQGSEPSKVILAHDALELHAFESGGVVYAWDERTEKFVETELGD